jgi:hypothetical protein
VLADVAVVTPAVVEVTELFSAGSELLTVTVDTLVKVVVENIVVIWLVSLRIPLVEEGR